MSIKLLNTPVFTQPSVFYSQTHRISVLINLINIFVVFNKVLKGLIVFISNKLFTRCLTILLKSEGLTNIFSFKVLTGLID